MKRLLLALGMAAAPVCALAQVQGEGRPLTCDRQEILAPAQVLLHQAGAVVYDDAERACWAGWEQAHAVATGPNGLWVDVRDAGARRQLDLPGVTAVDLADVPTRAFLKGQSLVLIGTGVDLKALSSQCAALRQSGQFKNVHVLLHGVHSWRQAGQLVQANGALLPPDEASAQEFWLGAANGQWRVAALGLGPDEQARLPLPTAFAASAQDLPQAMADLAAHIAQAEPLAAPQRWLVLTHSAAQLAQAQALWRQHAAALGQNPPLLTWLSGAWPAYASYLQQQQTLAAHAGRPLPRLCGL